MIKKGRVTENALDAAIQIISLAIVQNHLATKIKRPSLEVLEAIAKMTPKTKLTMKLVSWLDRQTRTEIMSFVESSAEKATDGSTIKVHGFTMPGFVCLRTCFEPHDWIKDSGCSKHMTGNKSLFSTYKAYDEGNVVFGSNLKGKIIGKESLNVTFDESSPPAKLSLLVDDDVGKEEAIKKNTKVVNNNKEVDYKRTKEYLPRVHRTRQMDEELRESYRTLEKHLFHEERVVTPSFIDENNMLPFFQAVGLEPFLTLNEPIISRFVVEFYHSIEVKRDEEQRPYIDNFFGPKHVLIENTITNPRTIQTHLLKDSNKLYLDEILPKLRGWELFFKENFFCSLGKRNKVNTCTAYMLYYLTIKRKFNFNSMLIYRMEKVKNKQDGPMPFAMLLSRLYNHIFQTNPQAIVPPARLTFHEHFMVPLDISRNLSKEKGKKIASSLVTTSSSSSFNVNEAPSFLEFYDELSDSKDLTKAQREKRGMFKCLNRYVFTITKYLET
nr:integrase, catalytic region, zinc finger, CCHC-type, peptidase aspartic, catalytic [Tanacetum cinerariifolium]